MHQVVHLAAQVVRVGAGGAAGQCRATERAVHGGVAGGGGAGKATGTDVGRVEARVGLETVAALHAWKGKGG